MCSAEMAKNLSVQTSMCGWRKLYTDKDNVTGASH